MRDLSKDRPRLLPNPPSTSHLAALPIRPPRENPTPPSRLETTPDPGRSRCCEERPADPGEPARPAPRTGPLPPIPAAPGRPLRGCPVGPRDLLAGGGRGAPLPALGPQGGGAPRPVRLRRVLTPARNLARGAPRRRGRGRVEHGSRLGAGKMRSSAYYVRPLLSGLTVRPASDGPRQIPGTAVALAKPAALGLRWL